ncbi:unnamed protein product [Pleuronectes platessa]|uniref:Uncharacterized protein n=1 Tax=Pleuronectes platessa TaxID=8262 RepID=A0A9N7Z0Y7_PLEPL|nr:unnamed protein product [Pleuronectes platessa]
MRAVEMRTESGRSSRSMNDTPEEQRRNRGGTQEENMTEENTVRVTEAQRALVERGMEEGEEEEEEEEEGEEEAQTDGLEGGRMMMVVMMKVVEGESDTAARARKPGDAHRPMERRRGRAHAGSKGGNAFQA